VKNNIRILSVIILAAIYCFAIGADIKSHTHSDFNNFMSSSHGKVISDISENLFCHTSSSENSVNNYSNPPQPNCQNKFTGLWAILKSNEQQYITAFSQYTTFTRTILLKHRKSDIIFPFQYFW